MAGNIIYYAWHNMISGIYIYIFILGKKRLLALNGWARMVRGWVCEGNQSLEELIELNTLFVTYYNMKEI